MEIIWDEFLYPYSQVVNELKFKFRACRHQYQTADQHSPIEFVTGRVKAVPSILEKAQRRQITLAEIEDNMEDIAGIRIVCQFVEDIYQVLDLIKARGDMKVISERDYITNRKSSGYRSYHVVVEYPIQLLSGEKLIKVEIQIRTLAMNFWATIEHSLNYKYQGAFPLEIAERLEKAAEAAFSLDTEMSNIRDEIKNAQQIFKQRTPHNDKD
ncbi:GTP pyrophosphokinase [Ligilactobacillus ceti]|uniref:GTP diphosphokinase n=1 Tax=Ligilactobacillus ceti DSM 22408 TaxID=1122146 RepID=A0A0R2KIE9_9LACO|nr:GTP pyrophosphokinase family protein [Ligilactobacillus ceti]KRN89073.1 GTP diphosphokinase [Ligilactobacillus ceti DSM 22408]